MPVGADPDLGPEPEPSGRTPTRRAWTRAGVVRALNTFAFFHGRPPSRADWKYVDTRNGWPSLATVEALFDSFGTAVGAAGFEAPAEPRDQGVTGAEGSGRAAA